MMITVELDTIQVIILLLPFSNWAVSDSIPVANLDGLGRIKIANCNIQFCLATVDTLGNVLAEPGIDA